MKNISNRITAAGLALGLLAPMAAAGARENQTAWGAATAIAGLGAVMEARDRPANAALLAVGAALAYRQYEKAGDAARDERFAPYAVRNDSYDSRDPRGYDRYDSRNQRPPLRPGARRNPSYDYGPNPQYGSKPAPYVRYDRKTKRVTGIVTATPGGFSREFKARLENGETRKIDVPRDTRVQRGKDKISVHALRKDEVVRVQIERYTESGTLKARRVEVLGRSDRDKWLDRYDRDSREVRMQGTVSSIDSRSGILRLNSGGARLTVYTDRADITDRGRRRDLRDLKNGSRVTVEGRRDGDRLYATRVTVQ